MNFNIPWLYIAVFVALCLFYYFTQKAKIRRDEKQERQRERMENLIKSVKDSVKTADEIKVD